MPRTNEPTRATAQSDVAAIRASDAESLLAVLAALDGPRGWRVRDPWDQFFGLTSGFVIAAGRNPTGQLSRPDDAMRTHTSAATRK